MSEQEFEIEGGKLVEIKTFSVAPEDDGEVNGLLKEGWSVLDVRVVELTRARSLEDGSPYATRYSRIIWILGRFEEESESTSSAAG